MDTENLVGKIVTLKILNKKYFQEYMSMFSETVKTFLHVKHDESEIKYLETRLEKRPGAKGIGVSGFDREQENAGQENISQNTSFFYCIFLNVGGKSGNFPEEGPGGLEEKLIGAIEIRDLSESDGQLYSWVNENYWGSGAYQEALALISKKYFEMCGAGACGAENSGVCDAGICATGVGDVKTCSYGTCTTVQRKYYTANVDAENLRSYYALKKFGFIDAGVKNGPNGLQYKLILVNSANKF